MTRWEKFEARSRAALRRQLRHTERFLAAAQGPLFVGAVVFAYFAQPLVRFFETYKAYQGAAMLAMALIVINTGYRLKREPLGVLFGLGLLVLSASWLNDVVENAAGRSAQNDRRCYSIESEMLSAHPRRGDLPELYAAFGCRTQTEKAMSYSMQR